MEDGKPICEDGAQLLAFSAGALSGDEASAVEAHLGTCPRCQRLARENEQIARLYLTALEPELHPSSAELAALMEGGLSPQEQVPLREHLGRCQECREIVSVLGRVQSDLDSHSQGPVERLKGLLGGGASWLGEIQAGMAHWVSSPVPAYLLVVLLAYPAYLGLSVWAGTGRLAGDLSAPVLLPPPTSLDSTTERGTEGPKLSIGRQQSRTVLTFFVPIAPHRYRYQVQLRRSGKLAFSVRDAKSFDGIGTFVLLFPTKALAPGEYELRVEEVDRQSEKVAGTATFPFSIAR